MTEQASNLHVVTFTASREHLFPNVSTMKYIHIPQNNWFGTYVSESVVFGDIQAGHRSIVRDFFKDHGIDASIDNLQRQSYINAGLFKIKNANLGVLFGESGGLQAIGKNNTSIDMMTSLPREKAERDEKTMRFLSTIYPSISFRSLAGV